MSYKLTHGNYILLPQPNKVYLDNVGVKYQILSYIGGFTGAVSLVFDRNPTNNRLFVTGSNGIYIVDATTFSIIRTIAGTESTRYLFMANDPVLPLIYITSRDGFYTIDTTKITSNISTTKVFDNPFGTDPDDQLIGVTVDPDLTRNRILYTQKNKVYSIDRTTFAPIGNYVMTSITSNVGLGGINFDPVTSNNRFLVVLRSEKIIRLVDGDTFETISQAPAPADTTPLNVVFDGLNQGLTYFVCQVGRVSISGANSLLENSSFSISGALQDIKLDLNNPDRYFVTDYSNNRVIVLKKIG